GEKIATGVSDVLGIGPLDQNCVVGARLVVRACSRVVSCRDNLETPVPIGYYQNRSRQKGVGIKDIGLAAPVAAIIGLVVGVAAPKPKAGFGIRRAVAGIFFHWRFPSANRDELG